MMKKKSIAQMICCIGFPLSLVGCDLLGLDTPEKIVAQQEKESKAIGSACRHGGRAIEDCYALNPEALKASVMEGWREMDEYMRENKLDVVPASIPKQVPTPSKEQKTKESQKTSKEAEDKTSEKESSDSKSNAHTNSEEKDEKEKKNQPSNTDKPKEAEKTPSDTNNKHDNAAHKPHKTKE